jgi:hypothetical protein
MLTSRPVIFISAVSKELRSTRDLVAKTLLAMGYEPKWQDIAPTETGDLRAGLADAGMTVYLRTLRRIDQGSARW